MHILIVTNSSNDSIDPALHLGLRLSAQADDNPTILKVYEHLSRRIPGPVNKDITPVCEYYGISNLKTRIWSGQWDKAIIHESRAGDYDLVVLGEIKSSGLLPISRKSQTIQVVERVPCSVLIVKDLLQAVRRILLCDSGATSMVLLDHFTRIMKDFLTGDEKITILHVMSQISAGPGVPGKQLRADVEALIHEHSPEGDLLQKDIQVLEKSFVHPVPKVRHGLVIDEIVEEARKGDYDLVVIGAHRYEGLAGYLLDNLAKKLVARLDHSVLILK